MPSLCPRHETAKGHLEFILSVCECVFVCSCVFLFVRVRKSCLVHNPPAWGDLSLGQRPRSQSALKLSA